MTLLDVANTPLSDEDLKQILGPKCRVMKYSELAQYKSLQELLPKTKSYVIILSQQMPNMGHFTTITRANYNGISHFVFFDSLGFRVDKSLEWCPENLRSELGQDIPILSYLFNEALNNKKFRLSFNSYPFQNRVNDYSTCGRWCVAWIQYVQDNKEPDILGFYKEIKSLCKEYELLPDMLISKLIHT